MEHSSSWEANGYAAKQEIPCILWNLKVHYPATHFHSESNDSGHTFPSSPLRFNLILSYMCTLFFSFENIMKWHHFLNGYLCQFPSIICLLTSLWSYYGSNLQYTHSQYFLIRHWGSKMQTTNLKAFPTGLIQRTRCRLHLTRLIKNENIPSLSSSEIPASLAEECVPCITFSYSSVESYKFGTSPGNRHTIN